MGDGAEAKVTIKKKGVTKGASKQKYCIKFAFCLELSTLFFFPSYKTVKNNPGLSEDGLRNSTQARHRNGSSEA